MYSEGTLKLVRPTFTDNTCGGGSHCGSGCYCYGADASKCVGCTCKKTAVYPGGGFICYSNTDASEAGAVSWPCPKDFPFADAKPNTVRKLHTHAVGQLSSAAATHC